MNIARAWMLSVPLVFLVPSISLAQWESFYAIGWGGLSDAALIHNCQISPITAPQHLCASNGTHIQWWAGSAAPCPAGLELEGNTTTCFEPPVADSQGTGKPNQCDASHTPNPVDIATGNKFLERIDYVGAGQFPLHFGYFYNSKNKLGPNSFRSVWTYPYSRSITSRLLAAPGESLALVKRDDGHAYSYGSYSLGEFYPRDKSSKLILTRLDGAGGEYWRLSEKGLFEEYYDNEGRLVRVVDVPSSMEQRLSYFGKEVEIQHSIGEKITLRYAQEPIVSTNNGFVSVDNLGSPISVTTSVGVFEYEFNSSANDRLEAVYFTPDIGGVQGERKKIRGFRYEDARFPSYVTSEYDERNRLVLTVKYNAQGRVQLSQKGSSGELHLFDYPSASKTSVTNSFGLVSDYTYDDTANHNILQVSGGATINCLGTVTEFRYDALGRRTYAIDSKKFTSRTNYNGSNQISEYYEGGIWSGVDASFGPQSRYTAFDYFESGRLKSVDHFARDTSSTYWVWVKRFNSNFEYWPNNRLKQLTQTDTTNETTVFGNSNGQQRIWKYDYTYFNGTDLPVDVLVDTLTIDGPLFGTSDKTVYRYNQQGHLLSVTNALNQAVQYSDYNGRGQPQTITDANGVVTTLGYHPRGWLEAVTVKAPGGNAALDAVTQYTWYPNGTLEQLTFPDGSFLHYEYNDARHLIEIRNNLDEQIAFEPNAMGEWTEARTYSASADMRRLQTRAFDELGRLMDLFGNNGQHTHYGYDTNSNLASIVENGTDRTITTTLNHDSLDRLKEVLKPVTTEKNGAPTTVDVNTSYQYDSADNLTRVTDPKGNATRYRYNGFGERIEQTSPDTGLTQYAYNPQGNLSDKQDARGVHVIYHYDLLGRLTRIQYPTASDDVRYYYDETTSNPYAKGRLTRLTDASGSTQYRYDHRGNVTQDIRVIGGKTYTTEYAYNRADNLTKITYPGKRIVNYTRSDALGRITAVTTQKTSTAAAQAIINGIEYQPFGPVTAYTYGNGLTRQVPYDLDYRIDQISVTGTLTPLNLDYDYDAFDNILSILNVTDPSRNESFVYDDLHRLQHAYGSYGTNTTHQRYEYDAVGNRTLKALGQGNQFHTTETYAYDPQNNQLDSVTVKAGTSTKVRSLLYNAAGNLQSETTLSGAARTYGYGDNNRLINLTENSTATGGYQHNALGQRVSKTAGGSTTHYLYGPGGEMLAEATSAGVITRHYLYLNGQMVAVVDAGK